MGYIDHLRKKGAHVRELSSCCPFCGSTCALLYTAPFGGAWHVVCDSDECGADFMFFTKETDPFKTAKAFSRRDGVEKTVVTVMKEYFEKKEEPECEVVTPHCSYGTCTDYPHCAGCGAAEWKEVNTDGNLTEDHGDL